MGGIPTDRQGVNGLVARFPLRRNRRRAAVANVPNGLSKEREAGLLAEEGDGITAEHPADPQFISGIAPARLHGELLWGDPCGSQRRGVPGVGGPIAETARHRFRAAHPAAGRIGGKGYPCRIVPTGLQSPGPGSGLVSGPRAQRQLTAWCRVRLAGTLGGRRHKKQRIQR
jgi:hypothetical protein